MSVPATNDNNARIPAVCMSRECALWLGAKPFQFDAAGQPLPLVPARPVLLVHGHDWAGDIRDKAIWMYWEFVPDPPELPEQSEPKEHA